MFVCLCAYFLPFFWPLAEYENPARYTREKLRNTSFLIGELMNTYKYLNINYL